MTLAKELGNRMGYLWTRVHLGHVALRAGDLAEARTIFDEATEGFQKDVNTIGVVFAVEGMAGFSLAVGQAAFSDAYDDGKNMAIDEVVGYALAWSGVILLHIFSGRI